MNCHGLSGPMRPKSANPGPPGTRNSGPPSSPLPLGPDAAPHHHVPVALTVTACPAGTNTPVLAGTRPPAASAPSWKLTFSVAPAWPLTCTTTPLMLNGTDVLGSKPGRAT